MFTLHYIFYLYGHSVPQMSIEINKSFYFIYLFIWIFHSLWLYFFQVLRTSLSTRDKNSTCKGACISTILKQIQKDNTQIVVLSLDFYDTLNLQSPTKAHCLEQSLCLFYSNPMLICSQNQSGRMFFFALLKKEI